MICVWRIGYCQSSEMQSRKILMSQGFGSTYFDGRWHFKNGRQVIYASSSRALCQLEKRVHSHGFDIKNQILMRLEIPEEAIIFNAKHQGLAEDWIDNEFGTRSFGNKWLEENQSLGIWVPSIIEPMENIILINPMHPLFLEINLIVERAPFVFDSRLF